MNATFKKLSALAIAFGTSVAIPAAYAQEKSQAKGKQNIDAKEKHAVKPANSTLGLDSSPKGREAFLPDRREKKTTMNH